MRRLTDLMGKMPAVMQKHWDKGISYHARLQEYDVLPKQSLKITVELVNAYVPAENESIHLDSLLSAMVANDVRAPAVGIDGKVFPLPLALFWISPDGYPLWACSDLKPESDHADSLEWWHKRMSDSHLIDFAKKVGGKKIGQTKEYRVPLRTVLTKKLIAYAIGNADEISRLLSYATHIGKKKSQGYGRVTNWHIEVIDDANINDLIQSNRPMPIQYYELNYRGILGAWTPPYWDKRRYLPLSN